MTAANWVGSIAASPGDDLVFSNAATQTNTTNNFSAGTSFGSINISGAGYSLAGNAVTLQGGLSDSGGDTTVSLPITLGAAQSILNTSGGTLTVGAMDQSGYQLTLEADYGAITVNGQISGAGGLVVTGSSGVILSAANTYTGTTLVNYSTLYIQHAQALGASDGTAATGTTLLDGGNMFLDGSLTVSNELLTVSGYGYLSNSGTDVWTGNIDIQGTTYFNVGQSLLVSGNLTSTNPQHVQAFGGLLKLAGTNTLGGGSFEADGTLQVDNLLTGSNDLYVFSGILQGAGTVDVSQVWIYSGALQMSGTVNSLQLYVLGGSVDPAGSAGTATLHTGSMYFSGGTLAVQLNSSSH